MRISTQLLHADDVATNAHGQEVAPNISVTTTFRHPPPNERTEFNPYNPDYDIYARETAPNVTRAEKILGTLMNGEALIYSSGLAAITAAIYHLKPDTIAIRGGYHGSHQIIEQYNDIRGGNVKVIDLDDDYPEGTLAWVETPLNPTGEARDLKHYAEKVHKVGGKLGVDATFCPPPLADPFKFGADIIMHSGTKYLSGHSDALIGVLCVKSVDTWNKLWDLRTGQGNLPGSMEAWLLLRSLRTLKLRVVQQAETGTALAKWFNEIIKNAPNAGQTYDGFPGGFLNKVWHASLQPSTATFIPVGNEPNAQMTCGPATFSITTKTRYQAEWFPYKSKIFIHATSLGGVESLMEHRILSDVHEDPTLIRFSIGLEDLEDIKDDLRQAAIAVMKEES